MTVLLSSDLVGGAIGAQVTAATEPIASSRGGTSLAYAPGFELNGETFPQSMETNTSGDLTIPIPAGVEHTRICFAVYRVSGTTTTTHYLSVYQDGTVNKADAILRNANGGNLAHRNNFTYFGQDSVVFGNGNKAWLEFEWLKGSGFWLHGWHEGNDTGTPSFSFPIVGSPAPSPYTGNITSVKVGNAGAAAGVLIRYAGIRLTDGAPYQTGEVIPPAGTLLGNQVGMVTETSFRTVAQSAGATSVELLVSTNPDLSAAIAFPPQIPNEYGYTHHEADELTPGTKYYWATRVDGNLALAVSGEAETLPLPEDATSFRIYSGSCHDWAGSSVFDLIRAKNPLFGLQFGDRDYLYLTGGTNGNTAPADLPTVLDHREVNLWSSEMNEFYRKVPNSYTYSDCDGAGANSDSTWPGFVSGAVQAAYLMQFAHPDLPVPGCHARAFSVGRWRFTHTDELTAASNKMLPITDPNKSKLGAAQLEWLFEQWLDARDAGQVVLWGGDGPWRGNALDTGTANTWARYPIERQKIADFIVDEQIPLARLYGDDHTLEADDGSNNPFGGFPLICAAPMSTTAHANAATFSHGTWPPSSTAGARQYGIYDLTDDGDLLSLDYHGYASTGSVAEVERLSMTLVWQAAPLPTQIWSAIYAGDDPIGSLHLGDELLWRG